LASLRNNWSTGRWLLVLGLVLIANSAWIAALSTPDIFYVGNGLIHPFLGIVVAILGLRFIRQHRSWFSGKIAAIALILLGISAIFGLYLTIFGMTRPHSLELYIHVGTILGGLFFLLVHAYTKTVRNREPQSRDWAGGGEPAPAGAGTAVASASGMESQSFYLSRGIWRLMAAVSVGSLAFYGGAVLDQHFFPNPEYVIKNPPTAPLSMDEEGGGAHSFMFPSSAQTPDNKPIKSEFFMNSESCRRCHPDIYAQWRSSMHHFSSFNNQWYRKAIEYMQDTIGIKSSLWCGGCHDHALVIAGQMQKYPIRQIEDTAAGQNGLGCMSCHAIVHVDSTMGQGGITFEYPKLAELAESKNRLLRWLHDYDVKLNPKPHREAFLKPFHQIGSETPKFCSACHKVHLDVPVNHYRWLRGFDDYDNWQASGVSGYGARSFYYPPKPQSCVDCHMPLVPSRDFGNIRGFVHSHRFVAANTAVPASTGDEQQVAEVEHFLRGALSVDIFALAEEPGGGERTGPAGPGGENPQLSSTFAQGEESSGGLVAPTSALNAPTKLMAPIGRAEAALHRGQTVRVEVVVRNRKVGHFFPGGTVDAFDCWVELQARDDRGRIIFWSGEAAENGKGPVDPGAHFYRSLQLDAHGNVINKRNAWSTHAAVYAHLIPPGAADTVHFRLHIPEDCGSRITLTAKLNYRKFDWWITQWSFVGVRDPSQPHPAVSTSYDDTRWVFTGDFSHDAPNIEKRIPDVPIVVIGENTVTIPVLPGKSAAFVESVKLDPADWERWNDYGIGLLLQGDLKGAERAFENVVRLRPRYADGWVNIARALIQEGNTDAAKPNLVRALELDPRLGSAHYFYGLALKADGDYAAAYQQFAAAAERYPLDRVNRNQMGRMLFLQRKYREAIAQYAKTIAIDPEDLEAHYNLMLCYRGLGNDALASREEKLYLRFKADEAARAITGPYELAHPEDNNEAQPIHEHQSIAEEPASVFQPYAAYGERWLWPPARRPGILARSSPQQRLKADAAGGTRRAQRKAINGPGAASRASAGR
jgi:tetratricopeptide (TPR) repeat protein